jgi:hypothetical protein
MDVGGRIREGMGPEMNVGSQPIGSWRALRRGALIAALALATGACASIQNMMPDTSSFRLPDRTTFAPTNVAAFARPVSADGPVGPGDLVNGQGLCAGAVPSDTARGVSLEMTECEVVRALGQPQSVEISPQPGRRRTTLTYTTGERAGTYQFTDGRLASVERGDEPPPPPPVAKKPSAKKPKPPA